ncbi:MAG: gliding motility-associated C-terminal domain-containing protein, partial [Bacteroidota bacterium]
SYEDTIQVTIPRGATYEGVAYEMDEEVTLRYQSVEGCDSIVVVQLQVTDVPTVVTEIEICAGESYENVIYENSTTLLDTIWTDDGAMDKILVTNILVLPTYEINKDTTLCRGESFAGIVMEESNIFVEEWQTTSGCDSLVVTDITVLEQYETEQFVTICERESYEGMTYLRDTSFTQTYSSQHGCDSLVTHYVTVLNQPTIPLAATQFICHVDELPLTLDAGDYATYQWSTGATERTIAVTTPGQYALSVTTQNGCRDSTVVDLRLSDLSVSVAVDAESCDSDALHQIAIDVMDGEAPFIYSINGGEAFETTSVFEQLQTGTYEIVVEDVGGCRAEQIIKIQPNENVLLVLPDELQVNLGDSIVIRARTDATTIDSIRWTPTAGLSCNDCLQPTAQPDTDQTYTLTVYTGEGCQVEQEVTIYVNKSSQYYAPTAFSPNDDGQNDLFTIYAGSSVKRIIAFKLYDRWGSLLYERSELDPRSEDDHWDGKVNGQPAAAGAYMYTATLELVDGRTEPIGGELILSR